VLDTTRSGRHRGASRYSPVAELSTIVKSAGHTGVKASAVLAASGGLVATFALPAQAAPSASAPSQATQPVQAIAGAKTLALAPAVVAPAATTPAAAEPVGVAGVKAVAKPKPKPKPKAASGGSGSSSSAAGSRSYSTSITGRCGSIGLTSNAARLCSAVQSAYGLSSIGGYRPNAGEHSTGQAVDFMISGRGQGDAIAAFVQSHAGQFNVEYVIWRQRYWVPGAGWDPMSDRGSATANHYDHVHVTVN